MEKKIGGMNPNYTQILSENEAIASPLLSWWINALELSLETGSSPKDFHT